MHVLKAQSGAKFVQAQLAMKRLETSVAKIGNVEDRMVFGRKQNEKHNFVVGTKSTYEATKNNGNRCLQTGGKSVC